FSYGHAFGRADLTFQRQADGWHLERARTVIHPPTEVSDVSLPSRHEHAVAAASMPAGAAPAQKPLGWRCDERVLEGTDVKPVEYEGKPVVSNAAIDDVLRPHLDRATARANSPLGVTLADKVKRNFRNESPLAQLMADLIRTGAARVLGK